MRLSDEALKALVLSEIRSALEPVKGRPLTSELAGEMTRRIMDRLIKLFPDLAGSTQEEEMRRVIVEDVHDVFREHRRGRK